MITAEEKSKFWFAAFTEDGATLKRMLKQKPELLDIQYQSQDTLFTEDDLDKIFEKEYAAFWISSMAVSLVLPIVRIPAFLISFWALPVVSKIKYEQVEDNARGFTPLHFAALGGAIGCADILIRKGADTKKKDNKNKTYKQISKFSEFEQACKDVEDEVKTQNTQMRNLATEARTAIRSAQELQSQLKAQNTQCVEMMNVQRKLSSLLQQEKVNCDQVSAQLRKLNNLIKGIEVVGRNGNFLFARIPVQPEGPPFQTPMP